MLEAGVVGGYFNGSKKEHKKEKSVSPLTF
jgi:hypothetical protein